MKPGRELDKLVAKVFGWKEWEFSNPGRDGQEAFRYTTLVPLEYDGTNLQHLNMIIPHYSTDISMAMVAFEWLEKRHPSGEVLIGKDSQGLPSVIFLTQIDKGIWIIYNTVSADTIPAAICLAVLGTLTKA